MKFIIAALAALSLTATPALAADNAGFVGPRAEVSVGINDLENIRDNPEVSYGAAIGVDAPIGDKFTIGVEANTTNPFDGNRDIGAAARLGYAYDSRTLVFAKAGYNDYRSSFRGDTDGLSFGAGVERIVHNNVYVKAEYRYTDFDGGFVGGNHGATVGVGVRF